MVSKERSREPCRCRERARNSIFRSKNGRKRGLFRLYLRHHPVGMPGDLEQHAPKWCASDSMAVDRPWTWVRLGKALGRPSVRYVSISTDAHRHRPPYTSLICMQYPHARTTWSSIRLSLRCRNRACWSPPKECDFRSFLALFGFQLNSNQLDGTPYFVVEYRHIVLLCARMVASSHACITRGLAITTTFVNACNTSGS